MYRFLFSEEKNTLNLPVNSIQWYIHLIPYISAYGSWSDKTLISPKRIFFDRFQKIKTCFKFQAKQVLVQKGPNRFLKTRFLVAVFLRYPRLSREISQILSSQTVQRCYSKQLLPSFTRSLEIAQYPCESVYFVYAHKACSRETNTNTYPSCRLFMKCLLTITFCMQTKPQTQV